MTYKAILFDLDGTLLDSSIDLYESLVILLQRHEQAIPSLDTIKPYCGQGGKKLVLIGFAIASDDARYTKLVNEFEEIYLPRKFFKTEPFPEINNILTNLNDRNIPWGIVTNRLTESTIPLPENLVAPLSGVIVCGDTAAKPKSHPDPLFYACNQLKIKPHAALYVGDSLSDCRTAENAGMDMCLAEYGYIDPNEKLDTWPAKYRVQSPKALGQLIKQRVR